MVLPDHLEHLGIFRCDIHLSNVLVIAQISYHLSQVPDQPGEPTLVQLHLSKGFVEAADLHL